MNININHTSEEMVKRTAYINSTIHPKGGYVALPLHDERKEKENNNEQKVILRTRGFGYVCMPNCNVS